MKNLDAAVDKFGKERVEVTWLPYIIDPGTAAGGEEYLAYNKRRWGSDGWTYSLKEQGRRVGAPFENWKWWPNTLKAHCLVHLAQTKGIASATVKAALFEALYEQGANLSSPKVLSQIAQKLGLSEVEVMEYLESGKGEQEVLQLVRAGQDVVQGGCSIFHSPRGWAAIRIFWGPAIRAARKDLGKGQRRVDWKSVHPLLRDLTENQKDELPGGACFVELSSR